MKEAVRRLAGAPVQLKGLVNRELKSGLRFQHPELWRRGFTSSRFNEYDLEGHALADYLSDTSELLLQALTRRLYQPVVSNKLVFHEVLSGRFDAVLPRLHGLIDGGRFLPRVEDPQRSVRHATVVDLLEEHSALVLKAIDGFGGRGIHVLRRTEDGVRHNGRPTDRAALEALQAGLSDYLVSEMVDQHAYAREIHPPTPNTLRIATMRDVGRDEPFLFAAVHRFGATGSGPVDSLTQGGLHSLVDLDSGALGPWARTKPDGSVERGTHHPDTGAPIAGVRVPHWRVVTDLVHDLAATFPYLPYVGWDVMVADGGPRVIEANHSMGSGLIQIHRPLLTDERVRAFFEVHGLLDRPVRRWFRQLAGRDGASG